MSRTAVCKSDVDWMHIKIHPWFCANLGVLVRSEASEVHNKVQVQDVVGTDITLTAYQPHYRWRRGTNPGYS